MIRPRFSDTVGQTLTRIMNRRPWSVRSFSPQTTQQEELASQKTETATLAGGCFWCTEAIFKRLKGILSVTPGYSGGSVENPTYEQVCAGTTGHAQAIQIKFDPSILPYEKLLEVFWHTHNPTTLNQQDNDTGTDYRSAIFYRNPLQKDIALKSKTDFEKQGLYSDPIVTEIVPFTNFFPAEDYHLNFFDNHSNKPYCEIIISPKIQKLLSEYGDIVKPEFR